MLSVAELIQQIHAAPTQVVLAASGGGGRAISSLLEVPGASRTVLEATIPYCEAAAVAWLGGRPDQFCSARVARAMAMAGLLRARQYVSAPWDVAGIGGTASLATDRPKKGPHRVHLAMQTATETAIWSLELLKGARSRSEEEDVVSRLLLNAVATACAVPGRLDVGLLEGEQVETCRAEARPTWPELLLGERDLVAAANPPPAPHEARLIFPGAFNPMHAGHRRMAQIAEDRRRSRVEYEISIINVDKPPLDFLELEMRLAQFGPEQTVWLSRAAHFEEKSRLFPGATFIVGVDTLRRIAAPQYYGSNAVACRAAIETIVSRRCSFLVFGRNLGTGFVSLRDLDLPEALRQVCEEVPADSFREDISSTAIRRARLG